MGGNIRRFSTTRVPGKFENKFIRKQTAVPELGSLLKTISNKNPRRTCLRSIRLFVWAVKTLFRKKTIARLRRNDRIENTFIKCLPVKKKREKYEIIW